MVLESSDIKNPIQDLSGVQVAAGENPYKALIDKGEDDPTKIQALYDNHRTTRNAQQRDKLLDPALPELVIDQYLLRIEDPTIDPSFSDERHGLVFWARPPEHILVLAAHLQTALHQTVPSLWLMPLHRMHMTALEICHSRTPEEAYSMVETMRKATIERKDEDGRIKNEIETETENGIAALVNHPYRHRARLVRPLLSYDMAAVALSFVPASDKEDGDQLASPPPIPPLQATDSHPGHSNKYTYHHLRRDLFDLARATDVPVASRYVVPSAHITLARFQHQSDLPSAEARRVWVQHIDDLNAWLQQKVWPATWSATASLPPSQRFVGEWVVGQERGLDARTGALWFGGGRSVMVGEGF